MNRGYRLLIAATCGIAILVALGTGAYFGSLYGPNHKQYQAVAGNQDGQNDYTGPSQSLPDIAGLPGTIERAIANPNPTTGEDHEKRDLAAQEASAVWAFWMVLASISSVVITAVGTIFLYKQIVLTRKAVEDTGEATVAMREANRIAHERNYQELRPYLTHISEGTAISLRPEWDETGEEGEFIGFRVTIVFKNCGATPARKIISGHSFRVRDIDFPSGAFPDIEENFGCFDLAPGDIHTQIVPYILKREILDQVQAGTATIHGFFRMTYEGLDHEPHVLQFRLICHNHAFIDGIWSAIPDHYIST